MINTKSFSKMSADELISILIHELKDPLSGLLGMTAFLEETELTDEQKLYLRSVHYSGEALVRTIQKVSDMAHLHWGVLKRSEEESNFLEILNQSLEKLSYGIERKELEVSVETLFSEVMIQGSPVILETLVTSLINYFIRYNNRNQINIQFAANQGGYVLNIKDCGTGFTKRHDVFQKIKDNLELDRLDGSSLELCYGNLISNYLGFQLHYSGKENEFSCMELFILKKN